MVSRPGFTGGIHMVALQIILPAMLFFEALLLPTKSSPYALQPAERSVVERAVMAEAGGENFLGQVAVAQAILDGALRNNFNVVHSIQKYQVVTSKQKPTASVKQAVSVVFDEGIRISEHPVDLWYATWSKSKWHESQQFVFEIGAHRFFWMNRGFAK